MSGEICCVVILFIFKNLFYNKAKKKKRKENIFHLKKHSLRLCYAYAYDSINDHAKVKCHKTSFSHPAFPWLGEPFIQLIALSQTP